MEEERWGRERKRATTFYKNLNHLNNLLQKASNFEISFSGKRREDCLMQTPLVNFTQVYFEKEVWRDDNQKYSDRKGRNKKRATTND